MSDEEKEKEAITTNALRSEITKERWDYNATDPKIRVYVRDAGGQITPATVIWNDRDKFVLGIEEKFE